ncbi:MAG: hypothetical protein IPN11_15375 [Opitutaceae bacterium]|nr:hypothetical protein [Opitutaceae bacterium]
MSIPHGHALRLLFSLPLLAAWLAIPVTAEDAPDEFTREVARYELTLPNLEAYGAVMAGLADWAEAKPAEAAAMRQRAPKGPTTYPQTVAHIESEPAIATQLKAAKLTGRDFVLIPAVVMQAQIAALGEAQGRTFPTDRINPKNTELVRASETRVREIMAKVTTDRARAFGR